MHTITGAVFLDLDRPGEGWKVATDEGGAAVGGGAERKGEGDGDNAAEALAKIGWRSNERRIKREPLEMEHYRGAASVLVA